MIVPITDPTVIAGYLTDASNVKGHCDALLRPRNTREVAEIVGHCQAHNIALTITAARTSTTAAPVPFGGWLMSMEHLNQIEEITSDTATAGAGIYLGELQREIEETGRFYPPDPTSRHECTLGASIACNASGARSFRYGATRPWVSALEVVLPDGSIHTISCTDPIPADWPIPTWTEPQVKTAAGYVPATRLLDVFIGQEGTLGIITRATVRLTELPEQVLAILAFFPSRQAAQHFVEMSRTAARQSPEGPLSPRCLEYLDHSCLALAEERVGGVPAGARAALFCEQEVPANHDEESCFQAWWDALEQAGALADDTIIATDPGGLANLHALRHAIPAGINEQIVRNQMPKVSTDLAVPDSGLDAMMSEYEACPLPHVLFGHIGDNHLHLNILPTTPHELEEARVFYTQLAHTAIQLGGTVSAEHGIGKIKKRFLADMVGAETLAEFRALKSHLDPNWILGRGTLMEPPE